MNQKKERYFLNVLNAILLLSLFSLALSNVFEGVISAFFGEVGLIQGFLSFIQSNQHLLLTLILVSLGLIVYSGKEQYIDKKEHSSQGFFTMFILILIVLMGFFLRFYSIGETQPFSDEYTHLANVKYILEGIPIEDTRFMLLNYGILQVFEWFEYDIRLYADSPQTGLLLARLPGVIVGTVTIMLYYFIGKKLHNRKLGLILALIMATHPLSIEMSKYIREYVYVFFILSLFILSVLYVDIKKLITKRNFIIVSFFILLLGYGMFVEPYMTLKFLIFFLTALLLSLILYHYKIFFALNIRVKGFLLIIGSIFFGIFLYKFSHNIGLNINYDWLDYFVSNRKSFTNGYAHLLYLPIIIYLGTGVFLLKNKKRFFLIFLFTLLSLMILYFTFLFPRYLQIRYGYYVYVPIILCTGIFIYSITSLQLRYGKTIGVLFFLAIMSFQSSIYASSGYTIKTWNKITGHYIEDYYSISQYLRGSVSNEDIVIASIPYAFYTWFDVGNDKLYKYYYKDEGRIEKLYSLINGHSQGFIVLDWRRNGHWSSGIGKESFFIGDTHVQHVAQIKGADVFRWKR